MKTQQKKPEKKLDLELHFGEKPFVPFEVDILAAEDFDRIYRSRPSSPERDLMVAILEEALNDYQRCFRARDKKGRKRFADAQAWIMNTNSEWIFSFTNCCGVLGVAPDYLRQGLLRRKQRKHARFASPPGTWRQKNLARKLFRHAA